MTPCKTALRKQLNVSLMHLLVPRLLVSKLVSAIGNFALCTQVLVSFPPLLCHSIRSIKAICTEAVHTEAVRNLHRLI